MCPGGRLDRFPTCKKDGRVTFWLIPPSSEVTTQFHDHGDDTMSSSTKVFRGATLVFAALAASACDDATSLDSLDDQMVLDAALVAADETIEEVTMWSQPLGFTGAPAAAMVPSGPARMGRPGGLGSWDGEFSGTRSVTFYDVEGVEQESYDALTTESINFVRDIEGSIDRDRFSAQVSRERDMTVSGLAGEETTRTWNGSGSSQVSRSGVLEDGSERSHAVSGSFTFEDVVVPIPGTQPRYPLSGTIRRTMTATRTTPDGTETREVDIVITFDGTAIAVAVVNGETMEINLAERDRNPLRRRP
jgi:hypothetical protein